MTTQVTPRMFSPSMETIASVRRSTICPFCSDVKTSSISLTLISGIALLLWLGYEECGVDAERAVRARRGVVWSTGKPCSLALTARSLFGMAV